MSKTKEQFFYCLSYDEIAEILEDYTGDTYDTTEIEQVLNEKGSHIYQYLVEKGQELILDFVEHFTAKT